MRRDLNSSIDTLLQQVAAGLLTPTEAARRIGQQLPEEAVQRDLAIAGLQARLVADRTLRETDLAVLESLRDRAAPTAVMPNDASSEPTLVQPASADATLRAEATLRLQPAAATAQRVVMPHADLTQRATAPAETAVRPAQDSTSSTAEPTQRIARAAASDEDQAARAGARDAATLARTLRQSSTSNAEPEIPGLIEVGEPERTQVMQNRLVASLAAAGEGHHGPLRPGSVIKQRFVLEKMLGKGGMGLVFGAVDRRKEEARDPNPRVALKVLNADFQRHPQSFIALQREARKAQTLAHPNVVTVFDFDRDGDVVYMTMELLEGQTLDEMVRDARGKGIGRDAALAIIRGIAEGLAYAHRKGIVHSDLKPGNIFVLRDGTPKILDFGIARAVPSAATEENRDEFDAGTLGAYTEAYATDEMVDGSDPHPTDDMYALGIIAYELVTGFHPYKRHSAPNARQLGIKPEPLKGLKRKEARAIESCLSFDRKLRPQHAGEFLQQFRGVTRLQQASLVAIALFALVAGWLGYQNYLETSPAIAFRQLPLEQQQEFTARMKQGNEEWAFFEREGQVPQLYGAIEHYARAYDIHPRNRAAVAGLNRAADALLEVADDDKEARRRFAQDLQDRSEHFRQYAPVVAAAQ